MYWRPFFIAALAVVFAGSANAQSVSRIFQNAGMIGTWASDCKASASDSNWYATYTVLQSGQVSRKYFNGPKPYNDYTVVSAKVLDNRISHQLRGTDSQHLIFDIVIEKVGNSIKVITSRRSDGTVLVKDGKYTKDNAESPLQVKCP